MIVDNLGRRFRNLRVSLTAACNYACTYCVPDGKRLQPAAYELSSREMQTAIRLLIDAAGIEKLRLTGGEPLLSPKFDELLPKVMELPLEDVSVTTNGQLILRKADVLLGANLQRLNVSLDTLDPDKFRMIARGGDLQTVLEGMRLLKDAGLAIKVNMVPMRTSNLDQVLPMLDYCLDNGFELRFIELMSMGHLKTSNQYAHDFVGQEELLDMISTRYTFTRTDAAYDSTAIRYRIPELGRFGIIANESAPFCGACTRLRLASNGLLFGCLSNSKSHDIKPLLDAPYHQALHGLQRILVGALADKQSLSFTGETTVMKFIGG